MAENTVTLEFLDKEIQKITTKFELKLDEQKFYFELEVAKLREDNCKLNRRLVELENHLYQSQIVIGIKRFIMKGIGLNVKTPVRKLNELVGEYKQKWIDFQSEKSFELSTKQIQMMSDIVDERNDVAHPIKDVVNKVKEGLLFDTHEKRLLFSHLIAIYDTMNCEAHL